MKKNLSRPRLALLGLGIMGGGPMGQGIPVLTDLFDRLSLHYDIVFYAFQPVDKRQIPAGIRVRQVISMRMPGRLKYVWLSMIFSVDHIFNTYDLIVAVSIFPAGKWAIRLGRLFGRPVVIQMIDHEAVDLSDVGHNNLIKPWFKNITHEVCRRADALVVLSEYHKKIIQKTLPVAEEISVLPLRVDIGKFLYKERRLSFPVQFIHIAYYSLVKDQDTLFRAFAKIACVLDCRLTIIGEGFNIPKVHAMLRDLKIYDRVIFAGSVKYADLPEYFDAAHVLMHSSRFEAQSNVIEEAMASGILVCGTSVGTLADIGDRFAVVVSPGDDARMAEKILAIINDPILYQKMTMEAHHWISEFDATWSFNQYKNFFEKLILHQGS